MRRSKYYSTDTVDTERSPFILNCDHTTKTKCLSGLQRMKGKVIAFFFLKMSPLFYIIIIHHFTDQA